MCSISSANVFRSVMVTARPRWLVRDAFETTPCIGHRTYPTCRIDSMSAMLADKH
jgi:hypothetical protein